MTRIAVIVLLSLSMGAAAAAQSTPPPAASLPQPPEQSTNRPIGAGELQKLFTAYTVRQAQRALQLSDAQYGRFATRFEALQDSRRKHAQAHTRILAELRRLTNREAGAADEALLAARLTALRDEDDRAAADLRQASDAVDDTLDVRQRARFRIFEERMEQQKLDLLMRARQNARPGARGRGPITR